MPAISQLYLYPVKSLAGFQVQQWPVDKTGLRYDRQWMLIDQQGQFLSQRRLPKMALITTRIEDQLLWLSAPGHQPVAIPLNPQGGDSIEVTIWHDQCLARSVASTIDDWLTEVLQHRCRLVYHPADQIRQVDQNYAFADDQTAFSDGFPFLIVSEASLQAFNQHSGLALAMERFRPNIVVTDCEAYAEDQWRQISINGIGFRLPKPCSRCAVPAIDPQTALSDKRVLSELARLRQWQHKVYFGQNALHDAIGELGVGNCVTVMTKAEPQPPIQ